MPEVERQSIRQIIQIIGTVSELTERRAELVPAPVIRFLTGCGLKYYAPVLGVEPVFLKTGRINGRGERIRTSGLLVPNQALYQAEPRPEESVKLAAKPSR
jgi:hypothetical protein